MKLLFLFFLLLCIKLAHNPLSAQEISHSDSIAAAIRHGNSRELANFLNATVQLILPGSDGRYSKTQAELIIRDFFNRTPPSSFTLKHSGESGDGSQFHIGIYKSGETRFRTYFLIKQQAGYWLIHQLRIEPEE